MEHHHTKKYIYWQKGSFENVHKIVLDDMCDNLNILVESGIF